MSEDLNQYTNKYAAVYGDTKWFFSFKEFWKSFRRPIMTIVVFSGSINFLSLFLPMYSMQLFDKVVISRSVETLVGLTSVTFFAIASMSALDLCRNHIIALISDLVESRISWKIVESAIVYSAHGSSPVMTSALLRDLSRIKSCCSGHSLISLIDLPWSALMLMLVYKIDPIVWIAAIFGIMILAILAWVGNRSSSGLHEALINHQNQSHRTIDMMTRYADVIITMGMRSNLERWWTKSRLSSLEIQSKIFSGNLAISSVTKIIRMSMQIMSVGIGVSMVVLKNRTLGGVMACSMLVSRGISGCEAIIHHWRGYKMAIGGYGRICDLMLRYENENSNSSKQKVIPTDGNSGIEVKNLDLQFGNAKVLKNICFNVKYGEIVCVLGNSGSGKTSLIKCIAGLHKPSEGSIFLGGVNPYANYFDGQLLGYVPQNLAIFYGISVEQNISRLSSEPKMERIEGICGSLGILKFTSSWTNGLKSILGVDCFPSGGQQQLISIARALYSDKIKFLLMDEPSSGLDAEGESTLCNVLESLKNSGVSIIFTTHRKHLASIADRVIVLDFGQSC